MTETLPWDNEKPLSVSQLLKQSMRSVDTIASNTSLLDKMSTHLNGLLRTQAPPVDKAVHLLDNMFLNASKAMETENDKQVLAVLQRQVSSFIGVTLGVKPFLEQQERQQKERAVASDDSDSDSDNEDHKLSWSSAQEKETSRKDRWLAKLLFRKEKDADIYAPDRAEHEKLRKQLDAESDSDGEVSSDKEKEDSDDDNSSESEYEEVIERIPIKSREIGGASNGFQVVRRKQKKKKTTIATNFTYSSTTTTYDNNQAPSYNNNNNNYHKQPRHRVRICEFRPKMLERLASDQIYCMPIFFPSEDSYLVFHSALATAKKTLYVCVFSFTDNDTADVLIDAQNRGVDVKIITDNDQMDTRKGADVLRLSDQFGIPYKMDNSDQFMHNKFAVIDNRIVITGSFNWSAGARFKNRENVVVTNIPSVVRAYAQEFEHLWRVF